MRPLLVRSRGFGAAMTLALAGLAVIGVGADEHPAALIVGDDFIEVGIGRSAQRTWCIETVARERMILEVERHYRGKGRNRINPLLAAGAEQLQRRTIVHLRIVEFWGRRRVHYVTRIHLHRIRVGG